MTNFTRGLGNRSTLYSIKPPQLTSVSIQNSSRWRGGAHAKKQTTISLTLFTVNNDDNRAKSMGANSKRNGFDF